MKIMKTEKWTLSKTKINTNDNIERNTTVNAEINKIINLIND